MADRGSQEVNDPGNFFPRSIPHQPHDSVLYDSGILLTSGIGQLEGQWEHAQALVPLAVSECAVQGALRESQANYGANVYHPQLPVIDLTPAQRDPGYGQVIFCVGANLPPQRNQGNGIQSIASNGRLEGQWGDMPPAIGNNACGRVAQGTLQEPHCMANCSMADYPQCDLAVPHTYPNVGFAQSVPEHGQDVFPVRTNFLPQGTQGNGILSTTTNRQLEGQWESVPLTVRNGVVQDTLQDPHYVDMLNYGMANYPQLPGDPAVLHMYPNVGLAQGVPEHGEVIFPNFTPLRNQGNRIPPTASNGQLEGQWEDVALGIGNGVQVAQGILQDPRCINMANYGTEDYPQLPGGLAAPNIYPNVGLAQGVPEHGQVIFTENQGNDQFFSYTPPDVVPGPIQSTFPDPWARRAPAFGQPMAEMTRQPFHPTSGFTG
ncbi:hypothetical protein BJV74DRAFT_827466 [Russula compacta]|nr:hypothetical protein BJV74DRAFT_827466 [Russula compacta]